MPKDKNDQSQLNQFMNKIDGAVTRALKLTTSGKDSKCGLILSGHVLSDPYFLHRWFEHNAAQNGLKRREVARRARNERRRAATFRKLEKLKENK
ncbi:hypothetical protein BLNAU_18014 [Blattamonas nauphoetae]|uniref:Uncharacterized protein n=1 Tax=Blattamonas nauphoetae TaxID=2049346 RepID=A0ABQ9X5G4_9EUKA|nr:hypothetical protein BLNAU_18014 [Blattamonas nauphoetae]